MLPLTSSRATPAALLPARTLLLVAVLSLLAGCGVVGAAGSVVGAAVDLTVDAVDTTTDVVTAPL